ncbi:hypothetical protein L9G74_19270 [Shewanella sp. C32]|uniref:Uncharacterized protein n=1 Tax=Shewanella electrica TaxID=515560 RepID=A0ABT2FQF4_9GAMM|nr:hypothetical protein [Shewanella electrica]MCH1926961.1 hypothetical protein [Shewanella electrica]MCS4558582.1 hypothetical protein [Shewanella electrica]
MELVALSIPAGWQVVINHFYQVTPQQCIDANGVLAYPFYEDMLLLRNPSLRRTIDLGWLPEGNADGCYQLLLLAWQAEPIIAPSPKQSFTQRVGGHTLTYRLSPPIEENWQQPLVSFRAIDWQAVRDKIHQFLLPA